MTIDLVHADLISAVAELRDVVATLEAERRRTDLAVDVLLDGGWSGRAADAYLEGWDDWRTGCDQVLAALATMAELVAAARADQAELDSQVSGGLRTIAGSV